VPALVDLRFALVHSSFVLLSRLGNGERICAEQKVLRGSGERVRAGSFDRAIEGAHAPHLSRGGGGGVNLHNGTEWQPTR